MTQPRRFKVCIDEGKTRLCEFMRDLYINYISAVEVHVIKLSRNSNRPAKASAVIAICMERQASEKIPEIEEIAAVACAVQNMHLTATAYGLGGFWSTPKLVYTDDMKDFLDIGEKDRCLG